MYLVLFNSRFLSQWCFQLWEVYSDLQGAVNENATNLLWIKYDFHDATVDQKCIYNLAN